MGFRQLAQKLERITPDISTFQKKQKQWPFFYRFSATGAVGPLLDLAIKSSLVLSLRNGRQED